MFCSLLFFVVRGYTMHITSPIFLFRTCVVYLPTHYVSHTQGCMEHVSAILLFVRFLVYSRFGVLGEFSGIVVQKKKEKNLHLGKCLNLWICI